MTEVLAAAWRIFGPVVLTWSVEQLRQWWLGQGGDPRALEPGAGRCGCDACSKSREGMQLDPDEGCFYWELPYSQQ